MTTPSVPRCGRMDPHESHDVLVGVRLADGRLAPTRTMRCPGVVVHEGGARCQHCGHVVCVCDAELARERHEEWYS